MFSLVLVIQIKLHLFNLVAHAVFLYILFKLYIDQWK